jgi:glycosyltransferase involved in cell wall biosynthesis
LKQKLQSVQDALPACSEVIIVNDGPAFEQPTRDLIATLGAVSVKTKGGLGAGAARNIGADHARGQWLLFLDDDDLIAVGYWQAVARYIDAHLQSANLAYGFCQASPLSDRAEMQRIAGARTSFHIRPHETTSLKPKLAVLALDFRCQKPCFKWLAALTKSCAQMRIQISTSSF